MSGRCPECGAWLDEDDECPECGYGRRENKDTWDVDDEDSWNLYDLD